MKGWTRRRFGSLASAACLTLRSPYVARSQTKPRVVVVGGGVAGATAAKYLAASGAPLDVTLVEPKRQYTTCFFSNLYLAGLRSLESLTHEYTALERRYGINLVHDFATMIDPVAKTVGLQNGAKLFYDCLIVAPGIAFKYGAIDGYDEAAAEILPHAWNAGPQTQLLRRQLENMEDGGVFLITAPPNPFRCPPGPYERASMVAYYFKQYKPRSKILILDAKDEFFEQDLFQEAWQRHYPGMIEWLPAQFTGAVKAVDVKDRAAITAGGSAFKAAVINVIPPQTAGQLAQRAGLADQAGWCPIHPATFESKLHQDVYVLGDAADAGAMPKSAFVANSQAKLCAFTIVAALTGARQPVPHLFNTCFTLLAGDDAVSDAIAFEPGTETIAIKDIFISKLEESAAIRRRTMQEANGWYAAFTHDLFG